METENDELEELRSLVGHLEKITDKKDKDKIVGKLQEIGKYILKNCYFEFEEGKKTYPLWIEAYYYNERVFPDDFCHKNEAQKNNFGNPYYHSGVDVCLSQKEGYYLSYLIKVSHDDLGTVYSQTKLASSIKEEKRKKADVIRIEKNSRVVDDYYRIGLSCNHDMKKLFYQECLLSTYFDVVANDRGEKNDCIKKTIGKISFKKEDFVKDYIVKHELSDFDSARLKKITKIILGYNLESLFDKDKVKTEELPHLYKEEYDMFLKDY